MVAIPCRLGLLIGGAAESDTYKEAARAASVVNEDISTLKAGDVIDGVTLAEGDRVLLKNQSTGSQNGIYVIGANAGETERADDFDENDDVTSGLIVPIAEGSNNADTGWMLSTDNPIVVGTTALTFINVFLNMSTAISGSGTTNRISKFTAANVIGDTNLRETSNGLSNPTAGARSETFGSLAMDISNSATDCTAFGYRAGQNNANGNVKASFFGSYAGQNANAPYATTAIGYRAGTSV